MRIKRSEKRELQKLQREIAKQENLPKKSKRFGFVDTLILGAIIFLVLLLLLLLAVIALKKIEVSSLFDLEEATLKNEQVWSGIALLQQSPDAGISYIEETYFLGDSNTVRLEQFGLVEASRIAAKQGVGVGAVLTENIVQGRNGQYSTSLQFITEESPKRILLTFGTNDIGNGTTPDEFAAKYQKVINEIEASLPNTFIVVNSIPPVARYTSYPKLSSNEIDAFNEALQGICNVENVGFLNSQEVLAGEDGYSIEGFTEADGVHYTQQGLSEMLQYYRTHAFMP